VGTSRSLRPSDDPDLLSVRGDIAEPETAQRVVDRALDRFGRIDTLVNNDGVFIGKPFTDYTLDDYAAVTAVNLAGFLPHHPAGHPADGQPGRRARRQHHRQPRRPRRQHGALGAGLADQGRASSRDPRALATEDASHGSAGQRGRPGA
jgi:NAD(P)-dependent dehydrogenase (short-subunit alcohol dehydrogenase family)